MTVYLNETGPAPPDPGRSDPVGMRPNVRAIKERVRIEDEARGYGEFRVMGGGRLLGRCLSPTHEDKSPSMNVYPDRQRFWCYGCGENGDVIDLARLAEGCEFHEALLILAQRHGVELPGRPEGWHRRLERQRPVRDGINRARFMLARKRLYRRYFAPLVKDVEDPEERARDEQALWEATEPLARHMLATMRKGEAHGS